jgi:hypothetical protein
MFEIASGSYLTREMLQELAYLPRVTGGGNCHVTHAEENVAIWVDDGLEVGPSSAIFWIMCTGSQLMDSTILGTNYRYAYSWTEVTPVHNVKAKDYTARPGPSIATSASVRRSGSVTINPAFNMAEMNHTIQPGPAKPWMVYQHDINNTTSAYPPNHKPCRPGTYNLEGVVSHIDDFVTIGYEMTDPETNEVVTWFDKMGTHQGAC